MTKLPAKLTTPETLEGELAEPEDRPIGTALIKGRKIEMYQFNGDQKIAFVSMFRSLERDPNVSRMKRYFDVLNRQAVNPEDMDWLEDQVMFEGATYADIIKELFTAMGFDEKEAPKTGPVRNARRARR